MVEVFFFFYFGFRKSFGCHRFFASECFPDITLKCESGKGLFGYLVGRKISFARKI
ncbi:hypothetical protein LEP1GSC035_0133 [Leptospira noguchii str. 2007001578]|uniref:Lipoprotein n=1 Tax=Leptospira noguchii str. 2007001578 TaxID=1049974 RepID=A0ABP2TDB4_9LEPT|nr:hypothetical protein LEP1GSC035_0133 [Leptospira noguchii str. 2007001578]